MGSNHQWESLFSPQWESLLTQRNSSGNKNLPFCGRGRWNDGILEKAEAQESPFWLFHGPRNPDMSYHSRQRGPDFFPRISSLISQAVASLVCVVGMRSHPQQVWLKGRQFLGTLGYNRCVDFSDPWASANTRPLLSGF